MIVQKFHLPRARWKVKVFYAVTGYYVHDIMNCLYEIECPEEILHNAYSQLRRGKLNSGFTYSSPEYRASVMVIEKTTSADEFNDSLQHEQRHLERHIANALGIDPDSEDAAYQAGDIAKAMFGCAKHLMCDCCRPKTYKRHLLRYER